MARPSSSVSAGSSSSSPGSPFAGRIDLFHRCDITFARSRRTDLHSLREVDVREQNRGIASNYPRTLAATYFCQLVETVAEPETAIPDLYALLGRALGYLHEADPSTRAVQRYESRVAGLLGLGDDAGATEIGRVYHRLPTQRDELLAML